jgi:hypothetical protein
MVVPEESTGSPEVSEAVDSVEMDMAFSRFIFGYDANLGTKLRNELRLSAGRSKTAFYR